ncbi:hypothetical protein K449DRAFT_439174 [Hypoxylon sp. EC38]|nr:hypothetical protein K449DRAFT_439174 [Hypoxylon sp. EC38]
MLFPLHGTDEHRNPPTASVHLSFDCSSHHYQFSGDSGQTPDFVLSGNLVPTNPMTFQQPIIFVMGSSIWPGGYPRLNTNMATDGIWTEWILFHAALIGMLRLLRMFFLHLAGQINRRAHSALHIRRVSVCTSKH